MGIYGILWVLQLDVNTYYISNIIVLVIKKNKHWCSKSENKL